MSELISAVSMDDTKRPTISLLIPTLNRPNSLKSTLESYFSGVVVPNQVVVVDQSTSIEHQEINRTTLQLFSRYSECLYFHLDHPSSTEARNLAFSNATGEIIVFSDDDIEVYPDTLANVKEKMADPRIAMIAGLDDNSKQSRSRAGYLLGTKSFAKRNQGYVTRSMLGRYPPNVNGEVPTEWAMGYFFVVRAALVRKFGISWDEKLTSYAYAEDLDFSYTLFKRATPLGYQCILSDKVRVKHLGSLEYRVPSRKSTFMYVINRYYLAYKHHEGRLSIPAIGWADFWMVIFRLLKRQNAKELLDAIIRAKIVRKKLKAGELEPSIYE